MNDNPSQRRWKLRSFLLLLGLTTWAIAACFFAAGIFYLNHDQDELARRAFGRGLTGGLIGVPFLLGFMLWELLAEFSRGD